MNPLIIDQKQAHKLFGRKFVKIIDLALQLIFSPLSFASRHNRDLQNIYHMIYPKNSSINDYIATEALAFSYMLL